MNNGFYYFSWIDNELIKNYRFSLEYGLEIDNGEYWIDSAYKTLDELVVDALKSNALIK